MDAVEDIRAPDLATLDLYCDRVASAVGRLSVRVFGMDEESGKQLAHHLGRALQLTNILRDIDEDSAVGRLYLPREALSLAGIHSRDPNTVAAHPNLSVACNVVVQRAREHFEKAEAIMARSPRRTVRAPRIMGLAYRRILDGMVARGFSPPRERVRVGKAQLIGIALRYAFI
jgi:presqualene diphosphate synthase